MRRSGFAGIAGSGTAPASAAAAAALGAAAAAAASTAGAGASGSGPSSLIGAGLAAFLLLLWLAGFLGLLFPNNFGPAVRVRYCQGLRQHGSSGSGSKAGSLDCWGVEGSGWRHYKHNYEEASRVEHCTSREPTFEALFYHSQSRQASFIKSKQRSKGLYFLPLRFGRPSSTLSSSLEGVDSELDLPKDEPEDTPDALEESEPVSDAVPSSAKRAGGLDFGWLFVLALPDFFGLGFLLFFA